MLSYNSTRPASSLWGGAVSLVILGVAMAAIFAGAAEWEPTPRQPTGEWGLEISVGRVGGQAVMYSCTPGKVHKSTDYGMSWSCVFSHPGCAEVQTWSANARIVYVAGDGLGVARSGDGGLTWEIRNNGIANTHLGTLTISPLDSNEVYVAAGRRSSPGRIYGTSDGGGSWFDISPFPASSLISDIVVDPVCPGLILFGTHCFGTAGMGVYRSTDFGDNWTHVLDSTPTYALTFKNDGQGQTVFAAGVETWRSTDVGETWSMTHGALPNGSVVHSLLSPGDGLPLFASGTNWGICLSADDGLNWFPSSQGAFLKDMEWTRLSCDPGEPTSMFTGEREAGFYRSSDGGATWTQTSFWLAPRRLDGLAAPGQSGHLIALDAADRCDVSFNGANDWATTRFSASPSQRSNIICPAELTAMFGCAADFGTGDDRYGSNIVASFDGGFFWGPRPVPWPAEPQCSRLAGAPSDPSRIYCVGRHAPDQTNWYGFIVRSLNQGGDWDCPSSGLDWPLWSIAVSHTDPDGMLLGADDGIVLKSSDAGGSVSVRGELPDPVRVSFLVLDARNENIVYAGTPDGVYRSGDGGTNWVPASDGIGHRDVVALIIDEDNPDQLWVATREARDLGHVYRTFDGAASWTEVENGLPSDVEIRDLTIGQGGTQGRRIYAATTVGVYSRDLRMLLTRDPGATWPNWSHKLAREPNTTNFHITYTSEGSIYYASSYDNGHTWSDPQFVDFGRAPAIILNAELGSTFYTPWITYVKDNADIVRAIRTSTGMWSYSTIFDGNYPMSYAGEPSLAPGYLTSTVPTAYVAYPVYEGDPPAQNRVYLSLFSEYFSPPPWVIGMAGMLPCRSPSVAVTPGDSVHVCWNQGTSIQYVQFRYGSWQGPFPVSRSIPPSEPASNPSIEAYGDAVHCVWHGPNDNGQFPGDVWWSSRFLFADPWTWSPPLNRSQTPSQESDFPVMATDFVDVWQEQVSTAPQNWDVWGRFAPQPFSEPFFSTPFVSRYPHADGYWESTFGFHCGTIRTEALSPTGNVFEVKFEDRLYIPSTGTDAATFYAVPVGESLPSSYCLSRSGFRQYGNRRVDCGQRNLKYRLPFLNPRRSYLLRAVLYREGLGDWTVELASDSAAPVRRSVRPGVPETIWVRVPPRAYSRTAVTVDLRRVTGDFVSVADLRLFQIEDIRREGGGGQSASVIETPRASLHPNFPNPFHVSTTISYELTATGPVDLSIFDPTGSRIRQLVTGRQSPGRHHSIWNGRDDRGRLLPAGVFFYRLQTGDAVETRPAVIVR